MGGASTSKPLFMADANREGLDTSLNSSAYFELHDALVLCFTLQSQILPSFLANKQPRSPPHHSQ